MPYRVQVIDDRNNAGHVILTKNYTSLNMTLKRRVASLRAQYPACQVKVTEYGAAPVFDPRVYLRPNAPNDPFVIMDDAVRVEEEAW